MPSSETPLNRTIESHPYLEFRVLCIPKGYPFKELTYPTFGKGK